jgi:hypothetical protein
MHINSSAVVKSEYSKIKFFSMNVYGQASDVTDRHFRPSIQEQTVVAIFGWCVGFDFIYWFIPEGWVQCMFGC